MFDDDRVANFIINRGLVIKGKLHPCQIYDKSVNLQQCFKRQMYKHIAKHCRRGLHCAYCAGNHDSGDCPIKQDWEHAKCANCEAENLQIKDPSKKLDTKHFAYARECLIRVQHLLEVQQRRTYGPHYHPTVARPGAITPGLTTANDPTPAEAAAAANERSPRAPAREAATARTAKSRSKSTAARKRAVEAEPDSPTVALASKPTTRSSKKTMHNKEAPTDDIISEQRVTNGITYESAASRRRTAQGITAARATPILQSDILSTVKAVHRDRSVRSADLDDESEDELSAISTVRTQANCWKSRDEVQMHLLGEKELHSYEILAIQEPYINKRTNPMTTYSQALEGHFHVLLQPVAPEDWDRHPRVCFYVNKNLDATQWEIHYHTRDLSTLSIRTNNKEIIHIHNAYNPGLASNDEPVLRDLQMAIESHSGFHVALGDFNLHHPLWAAPDYARVDEEATELIDIMDVHNMRQLLPRGTITYEKAGAATTIDLIWASDELEQRLVRCQDRREWWYGADHVPIYTEFSLELTKAPEVHKKQWDATDWDLFTKLITNHNWSPLPLRNTKTIDEEVRRLVSAIHEASELATPTKRITGFSTPGYTPEMGDVARLRRQARRMKHQSSQLARELHRSRIEEATQSLDGFWNVARWVRSRGSPRATFTPTLKHRDCEYSSPMEKAQLFREVLHPEPPVASLQDISGYRYPQRHEMPPITAHEVRAAISNVKPNKAPGPDGIPNL
ncbi:hypothetical protein UA08_08364, partial [Talaromyces atroroseus]